MKDSRRSLAGRIGAHESWGRTSDRAARTAPARKAFADRWERLADPDGVLSDHDRAVRAEHLKKAHFLRMAQVSAAKRRKRRAA